MKNVSGRIWPGFWLWSLVSLLIFTGYMLLVNWHTFVVTLVWFLASCIWPLLIILAMREKRPHTPLQAEIPGQADQA